MVCKVVKDTSVKSLTAPILKTVIIAGMHNVR